MSSGGHAKAFKHLESCNFVDDNSSKQLQAQNADIFISSDGGGSSENQY